MTGWMRWAATAVVAAAFGAGSALVVVQAGGADSHIEHVVQPSIDKSAKNQSATSNALMSAVVQAMKTRLDTIDQQQVDLQDRQYELGTDYDCSVYNSVSVVTVNLYGSDDVERLCVVKK